LLYSDLKSIQVLVAPPKQAEELLEIGRSVSSVVESDGGSVAVVCQLEGSSKAFNLPYDAQGLMEGTTLRDLERWRMQRESASRQRRRIGRMQFALLHDLGEEESDDLFTSLITATMLGNGYGKNTERVVGSSSMCWKRRATSAKRCSRTSLPIKQREAVRMIKAMRISSSFITPLVGEHLSLFDGLIHISVHLLYRQA
jgi:hypothetical protein